MRKRLAAFVISGLLAGGVVVSNFAPAEATHTLGHLRRQISRLENQVANLQGQVNGLKSRVVDLEVTVYQCEFIDTSSPTTFSDGTVGYPLYEPSTCQ